MQSLSSLFALEQIGRGTVLLWVNDIKVLISGEMLYLSVKFGRNGGGLLRKDNTLYKWRKQKRHHFRDAFKIIFLRDILSLY